MLFEVSNVNKHFGGLQVLQEVSFTLQEGEILGHIGPNGAGKSTLFNVVIGVYRPASGAIREHPTTFLNFLCNWQLVKGGNQWGS
jgi:branched-chain amino acid transport system ATP-binding protein